MQYSRPSIIVSPFSGAPVKPLIKEEIYDGYCRKDAVYTCPSSGNFIRKVVLSEEKIELPS